MTGLKRCHVIYITWYMIYLISHSIHATSAPFQFVGLDRMGMLLVYPIHKLTFYYRYRGCNRTVTVTELVLNRRILSLTFFFCMELFHDTRSRFRTLFVIVIVSKQQIQKNGGNIIVSGGAT